MSVLVAQLRQRISENGPLTVAEYMAEALGNPEHGYYMHRDPLGRAGDFITAPEVSQMFGELLGLWCADRWQAMGGPDPVNLVELGPGRGTLMADALRAAEGAPGFIDAVRLHLVETSPVLRAFQERAVGSHAPVWLDDLTDVPVGGPTLVLANEFFDALPVRQFEKWADGWHERLVDIDSDGFVWTVASQPTEDPPIPCPVRNSPDGSIAEVSPTSRGLINSLAARLVAAPGTALIIDYGHSESAVGDTLQAVKGHRYHDPLAEPGETDITAHVDFAVLASVAEAVGAAVYGPVGQGMFLETLGIGIRAEALAASAGSEQTVEIAAARRRLTDAGAMGSLFKVMAVTSPGLGTPPGF